MEHRFVGILVNDSWYRAIPRGRMYHESLSNYEHAGRQHGVVPCFFRIKDIRPGQREIVAYVRTAAGYRKCRIPAPKVIHNRTLYTKNRRPLRDIRALIDDGKLVFNEWNRYGKHRIHEVLMEDPSLREHLPETRMATPDNILKMMETHDQLILKPNSGSIGKGVMKLERTGESVWLLHGATRGGRAIAFRKRLPAAARRKLAARTYLIQQRLPLATYNGKPFDLRVSVQRDETGNWQMTGIAAKVAKKSAYVTNVARGGTVCTLEDVLTPYPALHPAAVREGIRDFSLRVAEQLSRHLPHLADIGLDVGLTEHGFPMFIECNGRDLRYSFLKGNMSEAFRRTYSNPIGYAKYLLDRMEREQGRPQQP